nr:hypothetical protein CFP56_12930 [Quercus suber]
MSAFHGVAIHLARRGVEVAQSHFKGVSPEYVAKLQHDAELYDQAGPEYEVSPGQFFPVLLTGLFILLIVSSIDYTLGSVVASLCMIESPSSTAIIEPKQAPPPYADEPDAPLSGHEKESLMPSEAGADADVEVTVINHKPITAKIKSSIRHLHQVGGFRARWRGLGVYIVYHMMHTFMHNLLAAVLGLGLFGSAIMYVVSSVALARVHMLWTHSMIAAPNSKSLRSRLVPRKQGKALLLPSLVYAVAQQACYLLPLAVAFALNLPQIDQRFMHGPSDEKNCHMLVFAIKVLAVPVTALVVGFTVLLPASVALTRIEAALLPSDMSTIVAFDRDAIVGGIDTTVRGGCRALFVQAWRSFDRSARLRLIKLYIKGTFIQLVVIFIGAHVMLAEVYVIGGEKLAVFIKSAHAQIRLMMIEAQQGQIEAN